VTRVRTFLGHLHASERGTALIETAILAPVLILMAVGTFEASAMVARQSELQSSAEQATEIALAVVPDTQAELDQLKNVLKTSSGLSDARITVALKYRCGTDSMTDTPPSCSEDSLNTYVSIAMTDEYQPVWTQFGISRSFEYAVNRTVQIS
jgi:Flp pilus assembly protein TadG